jgi:hypothetical protein
VWVDRLSSHRLVVTGAFSLCFVVHRLRYNGGTSLELVLVIVIVIQTCLTEEAAGSLLAAPRVNIHASSSAAPPVPLPVFVFSSAHFACRTRPLSTGSVPTAAHDLNVVICYYRQNKCINNHKPQCRSKIFLLAQEARPPVYASIGVQPFFSVSRWAWQSTGTAMSHTYVRTVQPSRPYDHVYGIFFPRCWRLRLSANLRVVW